MNDFALITPNIDAPKPLHGCVEEDCDGPADCEEFAGGAIAAACAEGVPPVAMPFV